MFSMHRKLGFAAFVALVTLTAVIAIGANRASADPLSYSFSKIEYNYLIDEGP